MNDRVASRIGKALSHPLRIEYLRAIQGSGQMSPSEFARDFGAPLASVAYHAKVLLETEVLEVADLIQRRGSMEHRHSLTGANAGPIIAIMGLLNIGVRTAEPIDRAPEVTPSSPEKPQDRLLAAIGAHPGATPARIAEAMEMRSTQVSILIAKARSENLVIRAGDGYELK